MRRRLWTRSAPSCSIPLHVNMELHCPRSLIRLFVRLQRYAPVWDLALGRCQCKVMMMSCSDRRSIELENVRKFLWEFGNRFILFETLSLVVVLLVPLPVSCHNWGIFGNDSIDIDSSASCRWCSSCPLDTHKTDPFSQFAWRSLCSPRNYDTKEKFQLKFDSITMH